MTDGRPTVCLFGIFNPGYSRSRMIRLGLERAGYRVITVQDRTPGWRKYRELTLKHRSVRGQYDVLFVCFPGQTAMLLARLISRKPIVFDAFTSLYDSDVYDRAVVRPYGLGALWRFLLDFFSIHLADFVLVDTEAQREYYERAFRLRAERIGVLPVGSVETIMRPFAAPQGTALGATAPQAPDRERASRHAFAVHFHGHYIPLQGVGVVLGAARELGAEGVRFTMIGTGQQYDEIRQLAERWQLTNVRFIESVPYEDLPRWMDGADVCLGIFGATAKGARVVPNKAYEAIACAKPLITQDSPASREVFTDGVNALLIPANNPQALAAAIRRLRDDPALRDRIARAGHELFLREFNTARIGERLVGFVEQTVALKNQKSILRQARDISRAESRGKIHPEASLHSSKLKIVIFFVLVAAFLLRIVGISYGLPYRLVGDEESFIGGGLKLLELKTLIPAFAEQAFDPYYLPPLMYYLSLLVFLPVLAVQYVASGVGSITAFRTLIALDPTWVWIAARTLSAVMGTATVWFVYAAGRDFVSRRSGVCAAALVATSFLAVSVSHFGRHWVPALLAVSLVLWASGRIVALRRAGVPEERVRRWYWLAGLFAGLGFGISYVPVLALAFVFGVHAFVGRMALRSRSLWEVVGIAVFVAVVMVALHPFAFFRIVAGDAGSVVEPKTIVGFFGVLGYFGRVLWAYDPMLFSVGLVGLGYLAVARLPDGQAARRLAAVFAAFVFIYVATLYLSFHHEVRYALLVVPVLAVAGGALVDRLMAAAPRATAGAFAVLLLGAVAVVVRLDTLLLRSDTRILAKAAVERSVPAGTGIATTLREVRLTPTRESLAFQAALDPASLRFFDRALLALPEESWPEPRYNLINLHFVAPEKLPADPVAFLRERGVRVVVVQYWNPADLTPAAERIRNSTALFVRFANLPGGRSRDFFGNDLEPIWDIFSAERFGPIVELRILE